MAITNAQSLVPNPQTVLNNILQTLRAGLVLAGVPNPQLDQSSDFFIIAQALANQLSLGFQNSITLFNAVMPDTAQGDDLTRVANVYGVTRKAASSSDGFILVTCSSATFVAAGTQLNSDTGLLFQVITGKQLSAGAVPSTNLVEVESIDTGSQTNLPVGSNMTWINPPAFAQSTATVYFACEGGADIETDSALRTRLLNTLQNPPLYGNWLQIAEIAVNASPFIEHAFVYPAINGPATQGVAFTQAQTLSNIVNRGILVNSQGWVDGYTAVYAAAPAYVQTIIPYATYTDGYNYSVANVTNDLSLSLNIPYPVGSTNGGTGGGWINFKPFPNPIKNNINALNLDNLGNLIRACMCTAGNSSTTISFYAAAPSGLADPGLINGVTQISWIADQTANNNGWQVQTATITSSTLVSASGNTGLYTVTINTPFVDGNGNPPQVGQYIFPASVNGQNYLNTVLASYAGLGPGQMNNTQALFPNAYRQPLVTLQQPDVIDDRFNQSLILDNTEVELSTFYYNYSQGNEPVLPGHVIPAPGNAPAVWVPQHIGFYQPGQ
jgi:hypothetical protein